MQKLIEFYEMVSLNEATLPGSEKTAILRARLALRIFERAMKSFKAISREVPSAHARCQAHLIGYLPQALAFLCRLQALFGPTLKACFQVRAVIRRDFAELAVVPLDDVTSAIRIIFTSPDCAKRTVLAGSHAVTDLKFKHFPVLTLSSEFALCW
jgi:hypothetical protein